MKKCNCGSEFFKAEVSTVAIVSVTDEGKLETKKVFDEYSNTETLYCIKCDAEFKLEDMLLVKCNRCGKEYKKEELNENGKCEICEAISKFDGLSQDDLIRKLLESEKTIAELKASKSKPRRKTSKKKDENKEQAKTEVKEEVQQKEEVKEKIEIKEEVQQKEEVKEEAIQSVNEIQENITIPETTDTVVNDTPQTFENTEELNEDTFIVSEQENVLNFEDNETFEYVDIGDGLNFDDFDLSEVPSFEEAF